MGDVGRTSQPPVGASWTTYAGGCVVAGGRWFPAESVLVVVILMHRVPVAVMQVVDMITMWHGDVPATFAMCVCMSFMGHVVGRFALVVVITMGGVQVSIVDIVHVVAMRNRHVPTAIAMHVGVPGVLLVRSRHQASLRR